MKKIKIDLIIVFIAIYVNILYGLSGTEGVGNPVLDLGVGARPTGMGGAFVAVCNDGNAGYWNPSGLSQITKFEIHSMYTSLFLGTKFFYLSLSIPVARLSELKPNVQNKTKSQTHITNSAVETNVDIRNSTQPETRGYPSLPLIGDKYGAFTIIWVESFISGLKRTDEITDPVTGQPYTRYEDFTARDDAYIFAYGIRIIKYFALGMNIKVTSRHLGYGKGLSVGTDLGILARIIEPLKIGLLIQDVGDTKMKWSYTENGEKKNSTELILSRLKFGASFDFASLLKVDEKSSKSKKEFTKSLLFSMEIRWQADFKTKPPVHFYTGVEWNIADILYLRMGFDEANLTAGVGIVWKVVYADYAYVTHPDLDNTHRISLAAKF